MFKWVVEFRVDKTWVEDGFDLTEEVAKNMIETELEFAFGNETKVKILESPDRAKIDKLQGKESE